MASLPQYFSHFCFVFQVTSTAKFTGIRLDELNDYCLMEIFKRLSVVDLCSLSETCERFRDNSQRIAPKKLDISITSDRVTVKYEDITYKIKALENVFENFGHHFTNIAIYIGCGADSKRVEEFLVNCLRDHCGHKLKCLSLTWFDIRQQYVPYFQQFFKRLQKLELSDSDIVNDTTLFAGLDLLVELSVYYVNNSEVIFVNTFPKLQRFRYDAPVPKTTKAFMDFISRHKTLSTLDFCIYREIDKMIKIFQVIVDSCKELKVLKVSGITDATIKSLHPLADLRSLTTLMLSNMLKFDNFDFVILAELPKLRELRICVKYIPEDSRHHLNVAHIVRCLTHLEEFVIAGGYALEEKTFFEIIDIVDGRPNTLTLICDLKFEVNATHRNGKVVLDKIKYDSHGRLTW